MSTTAHVDTFARDRLPPREAQPQFLFELPELQFPERLNCATELLDRHVREGRGERPCVSAPGGPRWTYADLQRQADRIAHVLVQELGLVPGNRVLLRAANKPMLVACWFAVMKAGGIAVATMPMLRAKELGQVIEKAQLKVALCDAALRGELDAAAAASTWLEHVVCFGDARAAEGLEARMARHDAPFPKVDTAADDTCLFAFTSGTRPHSATRTWAMRSACRCSSAYVHDGPPGALTQRRSPRPSFTWRSSSSVAQFSRSGNLSSGRSNRNSGCASGAGRRSRAKVSTWAVYGMSAGESFFLLRTPRSP